MDLTLLTEFLYDVIKIENEEFEESFFVACLKCKMEDYMIRYRVMSCEIPKASKMMNAC